MRAKRIISHEIALSLISETVNESEMRFQHLKLRKRYSTKNERRIGEILKRNKITFKAKQKVCGYEADFIIDRVILQIDGNVHASTDTSKDILFANAGYIPMHIIVHNKDFSLLEKQLIEIINNNSYGKRYR